MALTIPLNFTVVLIGAVIAQGTFAALLIFLQRHNQHANRYLSLLVLSFSLWLCDTFFRVAGVYQQNPDFYFLPIYFSFAFGPLMYFYTRTMTEKHFSLQLMHFLHFIPVLLQAALYLFLQLKDYSFRRWFWLEVHRPVTYNLEFNLTLLSLLVYLVLSIRLVFKYQNWIENQYSEISKISLHWLKVVQAVLLLLTLLWFLDALLRQVTNYYPDQPFSAIAMGFAILVLAIGGLLQADLRDKGVVVKKPNSAEPFKNANDIDPALLATITSEMELKQHFLNPNLTLEDFAKAINLPARQVSFHLNQGLGVPFIDFVNRYRVEQVKRHIEQNDLPNLTLLGIALESGFSSKSTFNRVFKKFTGESPSGYQKAVQNLS